MQKVAVLWREDTLGRYGSRSFSELWEAVGGNNGNLAYVHAIRHQIMGEIGIVPWSARKEMFDPFDILVVPCANQVGPHVDLGLLGQHWRSLGKPIVAIGLGVQANGFEEDVTVTDGTREWLGVLDSRRPSAASNIWTRGPYSAAQLARLGIPDATVGNCPTHFINEANDLGERIHRRWSALAAPRGVAVAAGYQGWDRARLIEQQLIALMQDPLHEGVYVTQSAEAMVRLSLGDFEAIPVAEFDAVRAYVAPHLTADEFVVWCRRYARSFYDVAAWMQVLGRHDLTIGPRYHGTALALQAERMGVTIAIDSRTEEMCLQTGVPFFRTQDLRDKPLTRASLKQMIQFDAVAYDRRRAERARAYIAFLEANGLRPVEALKRIAAA